MRVIQSDGSVDDEIVLTGRKVALIQATYDQPLNIVAGGSTIVTITPPAGELWRVRNLQIFMPAPAGAASGTHQISLRLTANAGRNEVLLAKSNFGSIIEIRNNYISTADSSKTPTSEQGQIAVITGLVANQANPIIVQYVNSSNVSQTGTIQITLTREVEYVVS